MGVSGSGKSTVAAGWSTGSAARSPRATISTRPRTSRKMRAGMPAGRRRPLAVAAARSRPGSASTSGPAAPSSSPARRSSAATATCSATGTPRSGSRTSTVDADAAPRPASSSRTGHYMPAVAARQPARHARAAAGRRARRRHLRRRHARTTSSTTLLAALSSERASAHRRAGRLRHDTARRRGRRGLRQRLASSIARRRARHRRRRRADHLAQGAPLPGAHPRLGACSASSPGVARADIVTSFHHRRRVRPSAASGC